MKYNHIGIPKTDAFEGEINLPHLKLTCSDHQNNPYGVQWMRYWEDAPYPDLVKNVPHVAFEVDDLAAAIEGQTVLIEPNSPSAGVIIAFIEVNGAPVELMQIDHAARPDLWRQYTRARHRRVHICLGTAASERGSGSAGHVNRGRGLEPCALPS